MHAEITKFAHATEITIAGVPQPTHFIIPRSNLTDQEIKKLVEEAITRSSYYYLEKEIPIHFI